MFDPQYKRGMLRQRYSQYANCFKVDIGTLRQLLSTDLDEWKMEVESTKIEVQQMRENSTQ